ncbi:DUF4783 domain-containing protein, partial [Flavitalea flava]
DKIDALFVVFFPHRDSLAYFWDYGGGLTTYYMKTTLGLAVITLSLILVSFKSNFTSWSGLFHVSALSAGTGFANGSGYTNDYTIDEIASAMKSGNIVKLSRYLDSRVDISLPEKSDSYSKSQAEMIIRDFFSTNGVQNFLIRHKGENGGSEFCVGLLKTRNGDYRTTLFIKIKGDKPLLQEIRFQTP